MSTTPLCCDHVWIPPLQLPQCKITERQHSIPKPLFYYNPYNLTLDECDLLENLGKCYAKRQWYLNIDVTCANDMNFHNFPFDSQELNIDIVNPYASRTWFYLTQGFLRDNLGEDIISGISLSPVRSRPGWFIHDLKVSSTCGTSQIDWKQTFLAQEFLIDGLADHGNATKSYSSQRSDIIQALNVTKLKCDSNMQNINVTPEDAGSFSSISLHMYDNALKNYQGRVNSTLDTYRECTTMKGVEFKWNTSIVDDKTEFIFFDTTSENINKSFSLLDFTFDKDNIKIWFPCAIQAVANLTTPGIRVKIIVHRYAIFYLAKLILPIIACVAFSFTAFGLQPNELIGRLTVVVPSAIALATFQGSVVSSDISPVPYYPPSTFIVLFSYLAQLLVAFESILVYRLLFKKRRKKRNMKQRTSIKPRSSLRITSDNVLVEISNQYNEEEASISNDNEQVSKSIQRTSRKREKEVCKEQDIVLCDHLELGKVSTNCNDEKCAISNDEQCAINNVIEQNSRNKNIKRTRIIDLQLMGALILLYLLSILMCIVLPLHNSGRLLTRDLPSGTFTIWD